jgi:DNA-binding PadR family transcriptional regulator
MSIKHVLLALLEDEPAHGYELKKRLDETLGSIWQLQQAQVYNNMRLLEGAGMIELAERVEQENLPDRKSFRLTVAGERELQAWTQSPVLSSRQLKDDFYLKLTTLARVLHRGDLLAELVWKQRTIYLQHLRELTHALNEAEAGSDPVTASLLEGAILHAEADLTWLDRIEERLLQKG